MSSLPINVRIAIISFITFVIISFSVSSQVQNYLLNQTVTDFTVTDVHGNTHTLSSITGSGKWVVLDFFFTTCSNCQATQQYFSELHEKYGCNEGDLHCLSIDVGDGTADVLNYENTYGTIGGFNPAPAVSGNDGGGNDVYYNFGPAATPTFCLINPNMEIKNLNIAPINSVADFESAFAAEGFTPAVMSCSSSGTLEISAINSFIVYPNPSTGSTTLAVNVLKSTNVVVEVYNLIGASVVTNSYDITAGNNKIILDLNSLDNGQYIVKIADEENNSATTTLNILK